MFEQRVLLVQCCHLPQFFDIVLRLRDQHPEWQVGVLVTNHPQIDFYLNWFSCAKIHNLAASKEDLSEYSAVIFPLLNRGYWKIKKLAWSTQGRKLQVDASGNLSDLRGLQLALSVLRPGCQNSREFEMFLDKFPFPELGRNLLILGSSPPKSSDESGSKRQPIHPSELVVDRVTLGSMLKNWKQYRNHRPDGGVIYASPDSRFASLWTLPFIVGLRKIVVMDENGRYFTSSRKGFARLLCDRLMYGARPARATPRILFFQTEGRAYTKESIRRLREYALYPKASILLICREEDRTLLQNLEGVSGIVTWNKGEVYTQLRELQRRIKEFQPDFNCAIFTGRPIFRKQKLAYFLLGSRQKLAFNASFECYWMAPRTITRIFRKEPLLYLEDHPTEVLLLETSGDADMLAALGAIQDPQVVPNAQVTVFCRDDKKSIFEGRPCVTGTVTYSRTTWRDNIGTVLNLFKSKPDVLAAVFSGTRIYPKHRSLFWLLPAYQRLAFNEHLDCFYVNRKTLHFLFPGSVATSRSWIRFAVRGALFLPRFAYLLIWWWSWKLGLIRAR